MLHAINQRPKTMKKTFLSLMLTLVLVFIASTDVISQSNEKYKTQIEKMNKEMVTAMLSGNAEKR